MLVHRTHFQPCFIGHIFNPVFIVLNLIPKEKVEELQSQTALYFPHSACFSFWFRCACFLNQNCFAIDFSWVCSWLSFLCLVTGIRMVMQFVILLYLVSDLFRISGMERWLAVSKYVIKFITVYPIKSCAGFSVERWPLCSTGKCLSYAP